LKGGGNRAPHAAAFNSPFIAQLGAHQASPARRGGRSRINAQGPAGSGAQDGTWSQYRKKPKVF